MTVDPAWRLARKALFCLDGERSHDLTARALGPLHACGLLKLLSDKRVQDPVQIMGLTFSNRIGLAAGLDKNAANLAALDALGFGFIEAGTVTPKPQPGNPKPRLFRLPEQQAILNRMGFNNDGLDRFVRNVEQTIASQPVGQSSGPQGDDSPARVLGLNIGKNASTPIDNAIDDYRIGMQRVYPLADYITINISSPNTRNLRDLQREDSLALLLDALNTEREQLQSQYARRVPVLVKIAPDLNDEQIRVVATALPQHGIDGVIATNTTITRDAVAGTIFENEAGGISGAPVAELANRVIAQLRNELPRNFPIIGVGGVIDAGTARSKLDAGADLVQLYTGLIYAGPRLIHDCAVAAREYFAG